MCGMRTTVDIPDELFRRAKAEAALRGRKLKDLVEDALRLMLEGGDAHVGQRPPPLKPSAHDLLKDLCGIIDDAPADLSTNPRYFDDFGR